MKAKSKKTSTLRSNSTKKIPIRNKSYPAHEFNLDKLFAQMKSDIINEMKKAAEIKFNEHKVNILKILNKSQNTTVPKKKNKKPSISEKKEKKGKIESDDDMVMYVGTEVIYPKQKEKSKNKKSKKKVTSIALKKNSTPPKANKNVINLNETTHSKSTATEPKLPKKGKTKKSNASDKNQLLGKKRNRGKEEFVNLSHNSEPKASSIKKKKVSNQPKKPSSKKKVK